MEMQRRVSPRLKDVPIDKRPYYGNPPTRRKRPDASSQASPDESNGSTPFRRGDQNEPREARVSPRIRNINDDKRSYYDSDRKKRLKSLQGEIPRAISETNSSLPANEHPESIAEVRVREAHRLYHKYYLHFVKEKEKRLRKAKQKGLKKLNKAKKGNAGEDDVKRYGRPDLQAMSEMLKKKEILYHEKRIGAIPGIEVGHKFYSRAEMVALGIHSRWLSGIDFMTKSYEKLEEYVGYTFPIAVAVVMSGKYEDDVDSCEEIVYTGQGGNDLLGSKRQVKDQVLGSGNLALKNNIEQSVPVRVIRGFSYHGGFFDKLYIYDGLYKVVECLEEKGKSGFMVYKYKLMRLDGQERLKNCIQVRFVRDKGSNALSKSNGMVCEDISNGLEALRIPVTNLYDNTIAPTGFQYIKSVEVTENLNIPPTGPGCECRGTCTNSRTCSCAKLNGNDFPYVSLDGGRLIEAKDVVFECGPNCRCGPECVNRTSQKELKYQLEVYRTENKGWAVRSWDFIPSGAPVCEYVGVLRKNDELEKVSENDYIFEIDCWQTMKGIGGRERRLGDVSVPTRNIMHGVDEERLESEEIEPEFCIDAGSYGNVARFINHSCDPNLFVQCVLSSHHDMRLARIVLFASDNIPPMQELTYDYGYALDSVIGPDGKTKQLPCYCGAADCRKRLY